MCRTSIQKSVNVLASIGSTCTSKKTKSRQLLQWIFIFSFAWTQFWLMTVTQCKDGLLMVDYVMGKEELKFWSVFRSVTHASKNADVSLLAYLQLRAVQDTSQHNFYLFRTSKHEFYSFNNSDIWWSQKPLKLRLGAQTNYLPVAFSPPKKYFPPNFNLKLAYKATLEKLAPVSRSYLSSSCRRARIARHVLMLLPLHWFPSGGERWHGMYILIPIDHDFSSHNWFTYPHLPCF